MTNASKRLEPIQNSSSTAVPENYVSNTIPSRNPDVWLTPTEVWEIKATQLTTSLAYLCGSELLGNGDSGKGLALRFPRFVRLRPDKTPRQATDSEQVVELFRQTTNHSNQD